jgi:hypothetical protein
MKATAAVNSRDLGGTGRPGRVAEIRPRQLRFTTPSFERKKGQARGRDCQGAIKSLPQMRMWCSFRAAEPVDLQQATAR